MANHKTAPPNPRISLPVSHDMLRLIAEIDEFKGRWEALQTLSPERLRALRHVATIESIGSSTRIEGVKLTDQQIETLLANLQRHAFKSRERLTISELERLTEANRNTLKVRLRELTQAEQIAKHGQGRATWYMLRAEGKDR